MESTRYRIQLNDATQGVGFRPFVFRLASTLALNGYVQDSREGASKADICGGGAVRFQNVYRLRRWIIWWPSSALKLAVLLVT